MQEDKRPISMADKLDVSEVLFKMGRTVKYKDPEQFISEHAAKTDCCFDITKISTYIDAI